MKFLLEMLGWPRLALCGAGLAVIIVSCFGVTPALFGPDEEALQSAVMFGAWIAVAVVIAVGLFIGMPVLWEISVARRRLEEARRSLREATAAASSPEIAAACRALRGRSRHDR